MKIIKMGNISLYRNVCDICSCEYEYDNKDLCLGYDLNGQYGYVICPCCQNINRVNTFIGPPYYSINNCAMEVKNKNG